jgi:hypothetical protein
LKFLLDSCVSGRLKAVLQEAGHDVDWCGGWPHDPGDDAVLAHAHAQGRTLVTLDKDFGELAIVKAMAPRGHRPLGRPGLGRARPGPARNHPQARRRPGTRCHRHGHHGPPARSPAWLMAETMTAKDET